MDYNYPDITDQPNIATYEKNEEGELVLVSGIQYDVEHSAMTNKSIECGSWWQSQELLRLTFTDELSAGDKSILDGIVEDNS